MTLQPGRRASKAGLESLRTGPTSKAGRDVPVSHGIDDDKDADSSAKDLDEVEEKAGSLSAI